jgi:hypothetical protein
MVDSDSTSRWRGVRTYATALRHIERNQGSSGGRRLAQRSERKHERLIAVRFGHVAAPETCWHLIAPPLLTYVSGTPFGVAARWVGPVNAGSPLDGV